MDSKHTLTILTRLASRRPEAAAWLRKALQERLEPLAETAVDATVETGDPMGKVLAAVIEEQGSFELARRLEARCAEDNYSASIALREASLVATRKTVEGLVRVWPSPDAQQQNELALMLSN